MKTLTFEDWMIELRVIAESYFKPGDTPIQLSPEDWQGYFDDEYSPDEAFHEDLSYGADDGEDAS